ncbi:MAG: hypothetical protein JWO72_2300 [Caulobacteraceae bacterium]|nr:hypothetical protein [Caulobacteraceae bacterium]
MISGAGTHRLVHIELDEGSLASLSPEQDDERKVAILDLLKSNCFEPEGGESGAYSLKLSTADNRLVLDIAGPNFERRLLLSMSPLRGVIKDYFMLCDSYYSAIRNATTPGKVEALDMGRRGVHDEAAGILRERLQGKVDMDEETARRLFTLVCALRWRG